MERKRTSGENLSAFAADLRSLIDRAYPLYNDVAKGDMTLTHFLKGIECGRKVRNREPKTINDAIKLASKMECRAALDDPKPVLSFQDLHHPESFDSERAEGALEVKVTNLSKQLDVMAATIK